MVEFAKKIVALWVIAFAGLVAFMALVITVGALIG